MAKGGKKVKSEDKLYSCNICGMIFDFETAFASRGWLETTHGKRAVKCFNPNCEVTIVEEE